jgi:hypothetical protein
MHTPVALLIFNRPELTEQVFAEIARARPAKFLVIADGPRPDQKGEAERCAATRAIIERVDWECEVLKNYSDVNLGCGGRPATGIRWVFEQVEEAIILEDDCLPHPTFFRYCEELLARFRHDGRVMHISGDNFLYGRKLTPFSYFFSCYGLSWGWASWRRAFQHYDREIKLWPAVRDTTWLLDICGNSTAVEHWKGIFDRAYAEGGHNDYWDFQWVFACWVQRGLSILPNINLISNIGFGADATHTGNPEHKLANLATGEMLFPLNHPPHVVRHAKTDQIILEQLLFPQQPTFYGKLRQKCATTLPAPIRQLVSSLRSRFVSEYPHYRV